MKSLTIRIVKQILNDKRSLLLILVMPLVILSFIYLLLGKSDYIPTVAAEKSTPEPFINELKKQEISFVDIGDNDADEFLKDKKADAVITINGGVSIRMLEIDSVKSSKVSNAVKSALSTMNKNADMKITSIYGKSDATTFDSLGYVLLGILSFFFVFLLAGVSFVRERTSGTMERVMLTPVKRCGVVGGYIIGFGIFAAIQSIFIILFTRYVLGMEMVGSVLLIIAIMIMLAFTAVAMGALVSIFANSEFQVMQFIPVIIVPQIFFSGLIPVDTLPYGLSYLAYIMPVYYGCTGLENLIIRGYGINEVWIYLAVLAGIFFVLFALNVLALKRYRKL